MTQEQEDKPGMFFRQMIGDAISFGEACKILNIEKYSERIFNCHPEGELYFLQSYIELAKILKDKDDSISFFNRVLDNVINESNDKDIDLLFIDLPNQFINNLKEFYKK
jgi:cellulose biosynthesis protein BcsQ